MGQDSKIEWTHHTGNLWHGCTHAQSIGCDNCYAEVLSHRWGRDLWGNDNPRMAIKSVWNDFARYQKLAKEAGEIHRIFVGSMMDIFEKPFPVIDSKRNPILESGKQMNTGYLRDKYFKEIIPATPNLMHLLLTKRPSNIPKYIPKEWQTNFPKNVMLGTSPVNQETAQRLIPQLLNSVSDGQGRFFLSVEPQLAQVDLNEWLYNRYIMGGDRPMYNQVNWVIVGGESGGHKRPFNPDWARLLREQCKEAHVPFFMKQWDKVQDIPDDLKIREFPEFKIAA